jgi:nitric oxide reductase large subunit
MSEHKEPISIWYFIGLLLTVYGVLITSAGIYDLVAGIQRTTVHAELHAAIWWGALLLVLGLVYVYFFSPKRLLKKSQGQ